MLLLKVSNQLLNNTKLEFHSFKMYSVSTYSVRVVSPLFAAVKNTQLDEKYILM